MAGYYVPLPGAEIRNALVDFSPVNNGLETLRDQKNTNRNALMQQQQIDMRKDEMQYQRGRDAQQDAMAKIKRGGDMAFAIQNMPDTDPAKAAAWSRYLKAFGDGNHTPEELDHRTGPKIAAAAAGKFIDQRERQLMDIKIAGAQSDLSNAPIERRYKEAQIKALEQKTDDPIGQLLAERMRGMNKPQQPSAPQAPMLQPQSFDGQGVMPGGVQLIADQQTAQPQAPSIPDSNVIDTPFGQMSRDEARSLAGPMLLNPKYSAAGKAILDSLDKTGGEMSKPAATHLDERTISAASTLGRLQEIRKQFKPEFQQIPERLKLMGASWGAAMGAKVNPQMQKQLQEFAAYKATAFDNFNQLLKELSGTAVSASELSRQKIVQPNPGEGLFDGDDPITLMSKVSQGEKIAKSAMARMNYMRSRGLQFNKDTAEQFMRLEDVPAAIDKRGAQIEQQLRQANPKASPQSLEQETAKQLKREFGI